MTSIRPRLIVGLGNPGPQYAKTRHNIGFMVVDALVAGFPRIGEPLHTADSTIWKFRAAGRQILLQKPLTYMNASGDAVSLLCRRESILPGEVLVVYDDLDLPLGRMRIRPGGSSGGHRGLASIIDRLGTEAVPRLRLGIDSSEQREVIDFVLSPFGADEEPLMRKIVDAAAQAALLAIRRDLQDAMNSFNGTVYQIPDPKESQT